MILKNVYTIFSERKVNRGSPQIIQIKNFNERNYLFSIIKYGINENRKIMIFKWFPGEKIIKNKRFNSTLRMRIFSNLFINQNRMMIICVMDQRMNAFYRERGDKNKQEQWNKYAQPLLFQFIRIKVI